MALKIEISFTHDPMNPTPNFFIVGAPKAGTTALHTYLNDHPQVCMSIDKEPNFFSHLEIAAQNLYYDKKNIESLEEYVQLFKCKSSEKAIGEASVSYLYYPEVAHRIYAFNPHAKIIISLREPVSRAFSHYQMDYSQDLVPYTFEEIVKHGPNDEKSGIYFQQYIQLGEYYNQVKRYIETFGKDQVLIFRHEDLILQTEQIVEKIYHFLGIDNLQEFVKIKNQNVTLTGKNIFIKKLYSQKKLRSILNNLISESIKEKLFKTFFSKDGLPILTSEIKQSLKIYYSQDIKNLQNLINIDLSTWLLS